MTQEQITAIATPVALALAGLTVHWLSAGTVSELGVVFGALATVFAALRNFYTPNPSQLKHEAQAVSKALEKAKDPDATDPAIPRPPVPPGAAGALGFLIALGGIVGAGYASQACALTPAEQQALTVAGTQAGYQIGACVLSQALAGAPAETILLKCDGVTLTDIGNIINGFFALVPADAGITITPAPQPVAGMCSATEVKHLMKLRDDAFAAAKDGGK